MTLINDSEQLRLFFPNSIEPVDQESTLYDKLAGFLQAAEDWAASALMPQATLEAIASRPLTDALRRHASRLVIAEALAQALPSLDVVLTPNGFGVVATANVAATSGANVATSGANVATSDNAEDVAIKKRMKSEELDNLIINLCNDWIALEELATLAERKPKYLRNKILPRLIEGKQIEMLYPGTPNHPRQKYKIKD